jgi:hypothetical protein
VSTDDGKRVPDGGLAGSADAGVTPPDVTPRGWSRRTRQVLLRFALLLGAYLSWGALALMMVSYHGGSSVSISSVNGHITQVTQPGTTLYQGQPGAVRAILLVLGIALLISTASVVGRVARRSTRVGVTGMVVAGIVGAVALLGMLTIGMLIVPLAAFLVALALPIAPEIKPTPAPLSMVPPGWYEDPSGIASWRYWDGRSWTAHTAPMAVPH